jgi:hypothetical protein
MLTIMLLIALAPAQPLAFFADYVFNVPVRIENMHSVTTAWVTCSLTHRGTTASDVRGIGVGGRTNVTLVDGAYNGTVTVTVPVSSSDAIQYPPTNYQCTLVYEWRNPDGTTYNESPFTSADRATAFTRLTGQAIAQITGDVSGTLPPP